MASQEELKDYLVGKTGYLKNSDNNSKVIMLSGKWGSGKTHFWQNLIATDGLKKELKDKREVYSYVSLYGKTSIEEIENDIFSQAYYSAIGGENFVTKGFSTFTKRMKRFGNSKIANGLKEEQKDNIERTALSRLNNGGLICFDDFERKSKDIDLNDLFGFITQLSLNFKCKIVIILNDDVFKGEEKNIFSNVKEKSVSKYLFYNPSIKELLYLIFENKEKYKKLKDYRKLIFETIEKTKVLNARIYIQVLDNLLEWKKNNNSTNDKYIIFLILTNINFILFHYILDVSLDDNYVLSTKNGDFNSKKSAKRLNVKIRVSTKIFKYLSSQLNADTLLFVELGIPLKENIKNTEVIEFIEKNENLVKSYIFLEKHRELISFESNNEAERETFTIISNFIETGILIKENN